MNFTRSEPRAVATGSYAQPMRRYVITQVGYSIRSLPLAVLYLSFHKSLQPCGAGIRRSGAQRQSSFVTASGFRFFVMATVPGSFAVTSFCISVFSTRVNFYCSQSADKKNYQDQYNNHIGIHIQISFGFRAAREHPKLRLRSDLSAI